MEHVCFMHAHNLSAWVFFAITLAAPQLQAVSAVSMGHTQAA